ncbi:transmembrane protein sting isoform X1 [Lasioglossum baleicum]|uniref:transmembrane protein sting isoform X1 n=1 Tax=Lasioglossum baleicum TaxID=434251 RepID=UPI003FCD0FD7
MNCTAAKLSAMAYICDMKNSEVRGKDLVLMIVSLNTFYMTVDLLVRFLRNLCDSSSNSTLQDAMTEVFKVDTFMKIYIIHLIMFAIICPYIYELFYKKMETFTLLLISWSILAIVFVKCINANKGTVPKVDAMQGLDYGTGMAYSYYYGYLKLVLPSTGTAQKGLIEKIENLEDRNNITIAAHKLFILIPSSTYIPPDFKEISYQWMESAVELEEEVRNRAGVKGRRYRNNVYKIYPDGIKSNSTPVYVVAEGATPILTFFEVQKHSHPETNLYKKHRIDIIHKFYQKLKELVDNDLECKDLCEVIYYEDYNDDGTKVNVAKVILERLT